MLYLYLGTRPGDQDPADRNAQSIWQPAVLTCAEVSIPWLDVGRHQRNANRTYKIISFQKGVWIRYLSLWFSSYIGNNKHAATAIITYSDFQLIFHTSLFFYIQAIVAIPVVLDESWCDFCVAVSESADRSTRETIINALCYFEIRHDIEAILLLGFMLWPLD